ncbi:hypothetical protein FSP39_016001 [Pinctada imbricata]|uniref:Polypeptide N-acetylgalactosaminyltransferase n=1 Tax=Pinctada imbricata TaxID=66713 RepID=A0AA88YP12_PINIB|nr:hypothetical protein FSP39_016001 [Pinctada imbricata]
MNRVYECVRMPLQHSSSELFIFRCSRKTYPSDLPLVSVIIPFRNEALSVLLRTVHSIINTTPQQNLVDIILVDDGSTDDDVKSVLEVHVKGMTKVKILRLSSSVGLMGSRQKGIENATSDIIVVMDSHMEVTAGWFEPIATEMKMDPKALLTGQVGVIDRDTFQFQSFPLDKVPENSLDYQTFDFYLYQTGAFLKEEYLKTRKMKSDPFYIPAIQGNFFMMNRTMFLKLGGFDLGMKLWGAEQFELSFKVWMCGGSIKCVPCSLAGHLYREIIWKRPKSETKHSNEYRLAAVWMDQYRNDVFEMLGNYSLEYGDVEERRKIRRTNKCKSFQYYLDKVKTFAHIYIPRGRKAKGIIQNAATEACLDGPLHYGSQIAIITYWCHYKGYNQYWELSAKDQLRHSYVCVRRNMTNHAVTERCKEHGLDEQTWRYNQNDEIVEQSSGLCLTANTINTPVHLEACKGKRNQKWFWTRLERDD